MPQKETLALGADDYFPVEIFFEREILEMC